MCASRWVSASFRQRQYSWSARMLKGQVGAAARKMSNVPQTFIMFVVVKPCLPDHMHDTRYDDCLAPYFETLLQSESRTEQILSNARGRFSVNSAVYLQEIRMSWPGQETAERTSCLWTDLRGPVLFWEKHHSYLGNYSRKSHIFIVESLKSHQLLQQRFQLGRNVLAVCEVILLTHIDD